MMRHDTTPMATMLPNSDMRRGRAYRFMLLVILGWIVIRGGYHLSNIPVSGGLYDETAERAETRPDDAIRPTNDLETTFSSQGLFGSGPAESPDHLVADSIATLREMRGNDKPDLQFQYANSGNSVFDIQQSSSFGPQPWLTISHRIAAYQNTMAQNLFVRRVTEIVRVAPYAAGAARSHILGTGNDMAVAHRPDYVPVARSTRRITLDGWALLRGRNSFSADASLAPAGQYGGSQAGVRIGYMLDSDAMVTAFTRISRPIRSRNGAEAAGGISVRPIRKMPVQIALERRVAIDSGGRNAFAAYVAGGFGPQKVMQGPMQGLEVESYGQAGVVGLRQRDLFADGMVRIAKPVIIGSSVQLALGGATWGGAQRGVSRIDIGPQVQVQTQSGDARYRLSLDWRERIAGNAQPGSGLAITLAAGF